MLKVLMINGSNRKKGCTYTALAEISEVLNAEGIETEIFQLGNTPFRDCTGCMKCHENGRCIYDDDCVNEIIVKASDSNGFVFGTPVYYAHPSGRILTVLDRVFYAGSKNFNLKPGAAIASARRAGTTAAFDALNKYFTISRMPVVSSHYWNMVHGISPKDVKQDLEGLQIMRDIGRNMAWILKCIEAGNKAGIKIPQREKTVATNFIR